MASRLDTMVTGTPARAVEVRVWKGWEERDLLDSWPGATRHRSSSFRTMWRRRQGTEGLALDALSLTFPRVIKPEASLMGSGI